MGRGTSRRPEHENEALTPSHDGCLQVKMDAPVGLQRLARESMQACEGACDWAPTWTFAIPAGVAAAGFASDFCPGRAKPVGATLTLPAAHHRPRSSTATQGRREACRRDPLCPSCPRLRQRMHCTVRTRRRRAEPGRAR